MAEDLAEFLSQKNIRVRYLHAEIEGLERTELIRQLRLGEFDVLIGINLLREGLDIPEVSLVVILDSDKEGFLRNDISLIQTFGRAARNIDGTVIMYGDKITKSMENALAETNRRRKKQLEFNALHKITPISIIKPIITNKKSQGQHETFKSMSKNDLRKLSVETEALMNKFAEQLEFEKAIQLRDKLKKINEEIGILEVR
jgi:excinuclease ABC subunit B